MLVSCKTTDCLAVPFFLIYFYYILLFLWHKVFTTSAGFHRPLIAHTAGTTRTLHLQWTTHGPLCGNSTASLQQTQQGSGVSSLYISFSFNLKNNNFQQQSALPVYCAVWRLQLLNAFPLNISSVLWQRKPRFKFINVLSIHAQSKIWHFNSTKKVQHRACTLVEKLFFHTL